MTWTINLMYLILWTSLSGAIVSVVWFAIGRLLEKAGFLHITYILLKVAILFWVVPITYGVLQLRTVTHGDVHRSLSPNLFITPTILQTATVFCAAWSIGAAIGMAQYIVQRIKITRMMKHATFCSKEVEQQFAQRCAAEGRHARRVRVRQSYQIEIPRVTGILHPTVVLPVEKYSVEERDVIFRHELTHVKHHDILFRNLTILLCIIHFMNPFAWWLNRQMRKWSEYACDYEVCCREHKLKKYYDVILNMAEKSIDAQFLSVQLLESESELQERMKHVMKCYKKKNKSKLVAGILVACITLLSGSSVYVVSAASIDANKEWKNATVVETKENTTQKLDVEEATELIEMTETSRARNIQASLGEVELFSAKSKMYTFNWNVEAGEEVYSPAFHASSSQSIKVSGLTSPDTKYLKVGITEPDGKRRYISAKGNFSHTFKLTKTGTYTVYAENTNSIDIVVGGAYQVVD
jgi:beta-lactamase regulating signal transducer with metallopeptidase domain